MNAYRSLPALTWPQVKAIRKAYVARRQGKQLKDLAARYGVSAATVWKAVNGIAPYDRGQ